MIEQLFTILVYITIGLIIFVVVGLLIRHKMIKKYMDEDRNAKIEDNPEMKR